MGAHARWYRRQGVVLAVTAGTAAVAVLVALVLSHGHDAAVAEVQGLRDRLDPDPSAEAATAVPTLAVVERSHATRLVDDAEHDLRQALHHLEAALPPDPQDLERALGSLRRLEGDHARRAEPFVAEVAALRDAPAGPETTDRVRSLLATMRPTIVGELGEPPPDPDAVLAQAGGSSDLDRCRLGMAHAEAFLRADGEERAEAHRRTARLLLRTVEGDNRGIARFALHELEKDDPRQRDRGVGYALERCR